MNKLYKRIKEDMKKEKSIYVSLLMTLVLSVVFGAFFVTILKDSDKTIVTDQIKGFFDSINSNSLNNIKELKNVLFSNVIYIVIIWLLGISIIGIPIIVFMLFFKGFSLGFSISSIILKYKFLGVFGGITYIFPHMIINMIIFFVISNYALKLSLSIFSNITKKKELNLKNYMNKYVVILSICILTLLITSFFEVFVSNYIIKIFISMIK